MRKPVWIVMAAVLAFSISGCTEKQETETGSDAGIQMAFDNSFAAQDFTDGLLEELLEQGVYSVELYRQRRAALSARQEQLQQLWKESNLPPLPPDAQDSASLPAFWDVFAGASPLLQNMLLKACVSKILYRKECRGRANGSGVSRDANRFTLVIYPQPFPVSSR